MQCTDSLVVTCRLISHEVWALRHVASVVAEHRLSCSVACGTLVPKPGFQLIPFVLQGGFLNTVPPEESLDVIVELNCVLPDFLSDDLSIDVSEA